MLHTQSPLLQNLLAFGRILRSVGFRTSSAQLADAARSLHCIDIASKEDFKEAIKSNLVSGRDEALLFDRAFEVFWQRNQAPDDISEPPFDRHGELRSIPMPDQAGSEQVASNTESLTPVIESFNERDLDDGDRPKLFSHYSSREAIRTKDFGLLSMEEIEEAERFLRTMNWTVARRRTRRMTSSKRGRTVDVRRLMRRNLRYGGELLRMTHQSPKVQPRRLVILCDISGSMDRYSRLLLRFLQSLGSRCVPVEVFLFGTRLTRVTHAFRTRNADAAITCAAAAVKDWAGGTRIGDSLREFNQEWSRRVLDKGAIVLIISDGLDRGDTTLLSEAMSRLQRASFRVIWLSPLLGSSEYRPVTQGIRAILPHVDDFLPVHNLSSLEDLAAVLGQLPERRPERRQGKSHSIPLLAVQDV